MKIPYRLAPSGLKMYSVTTVTSPYFYEMMRLSGVKEEVYGHASSKGTLVHKVCQCYALSLPTNSLPPEYEGYGLSFVRWFDRYVQEVIWTEKELVDEELGFYGHPDLLVRFKGQSFLSLPDIKTPTTYSSLWKIQLSAYKHLVKKSGEDPAWCGSLMLNKDGKMPRVIKHHYAARDLAVFLELLDARRYIT
jgi:hypothetical protein